MITPISRRFKHNPCRQLLLEAIGSPSIHAQVAHTQQTRSPGLQQLAFASLRWAQLPPPWARSPACAGLLVVTEQEDISGVLCLSSTVPAGLCHAMPCHAGCPISEVLCLPGGTTCVCQCQYWQAPKLVTVPWPICLPHNSGSPGQVLLTVSNTLLPACHRHPGVARCHCTAAPMALRGSSSCANAEPASGPLGMPSAMRRVLAA